MYNLPEFSLSSLRRIHADICSQPTKEIQKNMCHISIISY